MITGTLKIFRTVKGEKDLIEIQLLKWLYPPLLQSHNMSSPAMHLTPAEVGEYNINRNILDPNKKPHIFLKKHL